jgi:signal transduction histidine kinase
MRLYLKLYLYFVAVISILFIILPVIIFSGIPPFQNKLPHLESVEHILTVTDLVKDSSLNTPGFKASLEGLARHHGLDIVIYDINGIPLVWTGPHGALEKKTLEELHRTHKFIYDDAGHGTTHYVMPCENKDPRYAYISIVENRHHFRMALIRLLIACPIAFILIYPLALHLTKPLDRINKKVMQFSSGDFSLISGEDEKNGAGGDDEIARLDRAFNHMARELVRMIESKKELISDMSHELGSPLSRMQVAVDIMERQVEGGEAISPRTLKVISKNIDEMSKIVRELLYLTTTNKAYVLKREYADLEAIVTAIIQDYQILISSHCIDLTIGKEGDVSKVHIDRTMIARAIQNLLSNAIDYSPEHGRIEILLNGDAEHFSLTIKDMGPGIAAENKDKIFEPLFREDPSRTRKTGGTGLGLAIAKRSITLHGGTIWVENPGEQGAAITFRI